MTVGRSVCAGVILCSSGGCAVTVTMRRAVCACVTAHCCSFVSSVLPSVCDCVPVVGPIYVTVFALCDIVCTWGVVVENLLSICDCYSERFVCEMV